ncbi:MAG: DNA repair protein RecO [Candidatus Saccharibacteria bacterium]|nr:DNA repair protein RecO [Candidatus Saccharibacteria bacterium]
MSRNIRRDIKTLAYVLRRTNYEEADRILNLITPEGKIVAIAKGARRSKSKLAGGTQILTLAQLNLHFGESGMGIVTGVRVIKFYGRILTNLRKMELITTVLKKIDIAAESSDSPEYFKIVDQVMKALDGDGDERLIMIWFKMNFAKAVGEQVNMYYDAVGEKLSEEKRYEWDEAREVLVEKEDGRVDGNVIKLIRLVLTLDLDTLMRIKITNEQFDEALKIARTVAHE